MDLALNNLQGLICHKTKKNSKWYYLTHSWVDKDGSYLSQGYLPESERNSATGV